MKPMHALADMLDGVEPLAVMPVRMGAMLGERLCRRRCGGWEIGLAAFPLGTGGEWTRCGACEWAPTCGGVRAQSRNRPVEARLKAAETVGIG